MTWRAISARPYDSGLHSPERETTDDDEGVSHATVADIARLEGVSPEAAHAAAAAPLPGSSSTVAAASADASTDMPFDIEGVLERAPPLLSSTVGDSHASAVGDTHSILSVDERRRRAQQGLRQYMALVLEEDGGTEGDGGSGGGGGALDVGKSIDVSGGDDGECSAPVESETVRPADTAHHVIGCYMTQDTRVQSAPMTWWALAWNISLATS